MKYINKILLALIILVQATGCIREDMNDCDNVTIYFQYLADGRKDVLYQYMQKVDLYVFDGNGRIMGVGHYGQEDLKNFSVKPSFKLTPGRKYYVVALGNSYDRTEVVNYAEETNPKNIYFQHPAWESEGIIDGHDHNYWGVHEIFIPDGEYTVYRDTVSLYSKHVNVEIEVHGLPAPEESRGGDYAYALKIEKSNAQTDFTGNINLEAKGVCEPVLVYDYDRSCYRTEDLALFRMQNEHGLLDKESCEHEIVLIDKETNKEITRVDLYQYIKENDKVIDVTKQEAMIPMAINVGNVDVNVSIPDWVTVDGEPDWAN